MRYIIAVLIALAASTAHADMSPGTPATPCTEIPGFYPCTVVWSAQSGTETLIKPGSERYVIAFSRVQADVYVMKDFHAVCRADLSALSDGKADPNIADPQSFQTVELYCGAYRSFGQISLFAIGGLAFPVIAHSTDQVAMKRPRVVGIGPMIGLPRNGSFVALMVGVHEAASDGIVLPAGGQIRLKGKTFFTFDGALDVLHKRRAGVDVLGGTFFRVGAAQQF